MSKLVEALERKQSVTITENGAKTFSTSLNACLDLFFMGGAFRNRTDAELISLFSKAYFEDKIIALQILAYIRDCRGGMGERRFFRTVIQYLAQNNYKFNIGLIPELGRWDDILELIETPLKRDVAELITLALDNGDALCAKWMPRQGKIANYLRSKLDDRIVTPKEWRQLLVNLTKVVETRMCNKEWKDINYSHVPSIANVKYNKAFLRNDESRRREFLAKAVSGEVKINSSAAFPDDILYKTGVRGDWQTATAMWNQLPNYLEGSEVKFLPICDVSGSMSGRPMEISISLGIYLSERNTSIFKDAFITFSATPKIQKLVGDLKARYSQLHKAEWGMNTNIEAVYNLLLKTALNNKDTLSDMPTHLLIISDMEFDQCAQNANQTVFRNMKQVYKSHGYKFPAIVFWNVNSRQNNVPVRFNKNGVGLVSGASPAVLQAVLSGNINPIDIMLRAINKDKYKEFAR